MTILDGKKESQKILQNLKEKVAVSSVVPKLVILLIGDDQASVSYIRQKKIAGEQIGASVIVEKLNENISKEEIEALIEKNNADSSVHGIILQLPLPGHLDEEKLLNKVSPQKDVDGLVDSSGFVAATALGIMELMKSADVQIKEKNAVVVGRGKIAGKPVAELLKEKGANVSSFDSTTKNLGEKTRVADILVVAVGQARLIKSNMVKKGAVVVDVGINKIKNRSLRALRPLRGLEELKMNNSEKQKSNIRHPTSKLVGDVDFENVSKVSSMITPVPGGVGPMTVAALMQNLVKAATK